MSKFSYVFIGILCLFFGTVKANNWTPIEKNPIHEIQIKSHSLMASEGSRYQWYLNTIKIDGATFQELEVSSAGIYKLEMTDLTGAIIEKQTIVGLTNTGAIIRIFTIGDSTVQDYAAGYYPRKGWGQVLPIFFNAASVTVINKAVGGTSSKSFYNLFWAAIRNNLQPGDFVFIQFGINDRTSADPARYTPTGGEFESYLTKYVNETKAKGAFPVLVSTLRRNAWNANGTVYDAYHDHPVATRTVAKNLGIPLIDLDAKAKVLLESVGETYATRFLYNNYEAGEYPNYKNGNKDNVHFQEMGAIEMAKLIAQGIRELNKDPNVSKLIPFLKPEYELAVSVNPKGADIATTHTTTYPQGLTITLKTLPKTTSTFQKWNNAGGTQISTKTLTTVTSGTTPTSYTAMYVGATTNPCTSTITSQSNAFCKGGSVVLTANGGSSYKWFNGTTQVGTSSTYSANAAGSYTVEVTNNGCKAVSAVKQITENALPVITQNIKVGNGAWAAATSATVCESSIVNFGPHPNIALGWNWTGPNNFKSTLRDPILTSVVTANAGTYTATYTDPNGCKATSDVVLQISKPTAKITAPSTSICTGNSVLLTANAGSSYTFFKGTLQVATASTLLVSEAGTYTVEVTNNDGCKAVSAPTQITVTNALTWYADTDKDGTGDPTSTQVSCTKPNGYVAIAGDGCPTDAKKSMPGNCGCGKTETECLDCAGTPNGTAVLDNCNICVGGTTGNKECISTGTLNARAANIQVVPQPFDLNTTIKLENQGNIQSITIINVSGAIVKTLHGLNTNEITLGDDLTSGLYSVLIQSEKGMLVTKIIKK